MQIEDGEHDVPKGGFFTPKLYMQRYEYVKKVIKTENARSIIDLGCGDCSFMKEVSSLNNIEHLIGVDLHPPTLAKGIGTFTDDFDQATNAKVRRKVDLDIEIYRGDVTDECDPRLRSVDCVTCIELIEHIDEKYHRSLAKTIFDSIKPKYAIITTPNVEFNKHFKMTEGQLRHYDHRFEWTRAQFRHFVRKVLKKYPDYEATIEGIGKHWGGDESAGHCSQVAIFKLISPDTRDRTELRKFSGLEQTFERRHRVTYPKYDFKTRLFNEVINRQRKVASPPTLPPSQPRMQPPTPPLSPARLFMMPIIPHRICAVCSKPQYRVQLYQPRQVLAYHCLIKPPHNVIRSSPGPVVQGYYIPPGVGCTAAEHNNYRTF